MAWLYRSSDATASLRRALPDRSRLLELQWRQISGSESLCQTVLLHITCHMMCVLSPLVRMTFLPITDLVRAEELYAMKEPAEEMPEKSPDTFSIVRELEDIGRAMMLGS